MQTGLGQFGPGWGNATILGFSECSGSTHFASPLGVSPNAAAGGVALGPVVLSRTLLGKQLPARKEGGRGTVL